jgi:hypothetical protein
MWGRRGKRSGRLARQLSLGLLEDAMSRAEQPEAYRLDATGPSADEPGAGHPAAGQHEPYASTIPAQAEALPPPRAGEQAGLEPADVPVDNSAGPVAGQTAPPRQRQRRGEHPAKSTRHRSLG